MYVYQFTLLIVFTLIAGMMLIDKNVADYISIIASIIKMHFERMKFMMIYHPKNPITNYIQSQKMKKIAIELMKEYNIDQ
jgi:hypothetical protein